MSSPRFGSSFTQQCFTIALHLLFLLVSSAIVQPTRYVLQAGRSGFYTYAIFDHPQGWPDLKIDQARITLNLKARMFNFMAISDHIQRRMPTAADRVYGSQPLAYKEAVLLTHPSNPTFKGEVDDKYQYSLESKDTNVHGWICPKPHIGFWVITGSSEFRSGGPIKQDLTSHVGPVALSMFFSNHYAGKIHSVSLRNGEAWKKVHKQKVNVSKICIRWTGSTRKRWIVATRRQGDNINVRNLVFYPPRNGPTLWEIGIPDRKASEFFVPDPKPGLVNRVFINRTAEKFRQYGLWDRYTDYYPKHDLVYTVGKSDYTRDWFFAHVNR
nr:probable rhamnogalacturonate lyase B [Ipomoea batatas]